MSEREDQSPTWNLLCWMLLGVALLGFLAGYNAGYRAAVNYEVHERVR